MLPVCLSSDLSLARRLEAAEAANGFAWVEAVGASVVAASLLGGCAMYAGEGSPLTHALGIGMDGPITPAGFDELEAFFRTHQSASLIDLCPLAHTTVLEEVFRRNYRVIELNNIMVRDIGTGILPAPGVRRIAPAEGERWGMAVAQGFAGSDEVPESLRGVLDATPKFSHCFVAEVDSQFAAGGALGIRGGTAMFYGDSTRMTFRGRGYQLALIQQRLNTASELGCDIAMVTVVPGTSSHRNYERAGFRLAYMRVNVSRELD